jgi:hypothetical protein
MPLSSFKANSSFQVYWNPSQKCLLASRLLAGLVPRFPALRDDPPNFIFMVGLKSFDPPQADLRFATPKGVRSDGESSNAGKLGPAARVPAKPFGEDGILNQNPIFETGSIKPLFNRF